MHPDRKLGSKPRKGISKEASPIRRKKGEFKEEVISGEKAKQAAYHAILLKLKEGKKLTASDHRIIDEIEQKEKQEQAKIVRIDVPDVPATLGEDLEEWTLRDGVVRGRVRRLAEIGALYETETKALEKALQKVQRALLTRYGFEGGKRTGHLTGNEALALQWVKSIAQLSRASAEWELQMDAAETARESGSGVSMERFAALVMTMKQLAEKRDGLVIKVRELGAKEKKAGTARGERAQSFEIVISDGPSS